MAMQEVVCADCGAINQWVAHSCWRCLEPLSDRSAAAAQIAEPLPDARPATA
jgi:predicted amidophosphoribosyltransferase